MKKIALFLVNVAAVIALTILTIKLFPLPQLTHEQATGLVDMSEFFRFNDAEWFGTIVFGGLYLLVGALEWCLIRVTYRRLGG